MVKVFYLQVGSFARFRRVVVCTKRGWCMKFREGKKSDCLAEIRPVELAFLELS